jgi:hypothetical protein
MMANWGGSHVKKARQRMAAMLPAPCWRCGRILTNDDPGSWVVGHLIERDLRPDLMLDPDNQAPECRPCSNRSGAIYGNRKRGLTRRQVSPTSRDW